MPISAQIIDGTVILVSTADSQALWKLGYYGSNPHELHEHFLQRSSLSKVEAVYLWELNVISFDVQSPQAEANLSSQLEDSSIVDKLLQSDSDLLRYLVYRALRTPGWVVRPGLNYGTDFLLYRLGPDRDHSEFAVLVVEKKRDSGPIWRDIHACSRVCAGAKKKLLIALIEESHSASSNVDWLDRHFRLSLVGIERWVPEEVRLGDRMTTKASSISLKR